MWKLNTFACFYIKQVKVYFLFEGNMKKATFYTELAYLFGIAALALGTAFMEKANMGISMVVAPAYLVYLKLSKVWTFVTFGWRSIHCRYAFLLS
jgi:hypothetical protein